MPTLASLSADVTGWLNRGDVGSLIPGWVTMTETDCNEQLRARCMVVGGIQAIDAPFIALPSDFASMHSLRDARSGRLLKLEDEFSGPPGNDFNTWERVHAYRLIGDCIEFLPHPVIPDPPVEGWQPQTVMMRWFQKLPPLRDPQDTNNVLTELYSVYLFGVCRYGAMYELDDERAQQMTQAFNQAVGFANLWKQSSDYSGAPLRAVAGAVF